MLGFAGVDHASFWRTIPGLLTAVAGLVTAVTGLLLALPKVGLLERPRTPANISGVWVADVTYGWGATYKERFSLQADGTRVVGTATFLGVPRAAVGGTLDGDTFSFTVQGEELLGADRRPFQLTYRGTVVGGGLHVVVEDSRGHPPIQFAAMRE
jgi:hypothetical protein